MVNNAGCGLPSPIATGIQRRDAPDIHRSVPVKTRLGLPMSLTTDFTGTAAIVTGGSSGIGLATVQALTARGAGVISLDLACPIGESVSWIACDVSDDESVESAVGELADLLGRLDVVINNAGIGAIGRVDDNSDQEWARVLDVNVLGIARVSRAAPPPSSLRL